MAIQFIVQWETLPTVKREAINNYTEKSGIKQDFPRQMGT